MAVPSFNSMEEAIDAINKMPGISDKMRQDLIGQVQASFPEGVPAGAKEGADFIDGIDGLQPFQRDALKRDLIEGLGTREAAVDTPGGGPTGALFDDLRNKAEAFGLRENQGFGQKEFLRDVLGAQGLETFLNRQPVERGLSELITGALGQEGFNPFQSPDLQQFTPDSQGLAALMGTQSAPVIPQQGGFNPFVDAPPQQAQQLQQGIAPQAQGGQLAALQQLQAGQAAPQQQAAPQLGALQQLQQQLAQPPVVAAAGGFQGQVNRPTTFLAGEAGPESVNIQPQGGGRAPTSGGNPNPVNLGGAGGPGLPPPPGPGGGGFFNAGGAQPPVQSPGFGPPTGPFQDHAGGGSGLPGQNTGPGGFNGNRGINPGGTMFGGAGGQQAQQTGRGGGIGGGSNVVLPPGGGASGSGATGAQNPLAGGTGTGGGQGGGQTIQPPNAGDLAAGRTDAQNARAAQRNQAAAQQGNIQRTSEQRAQDTQAIAQGLPDAVKNQQAQGGGQGGGPAPPAQGQFGGPGVGGVPNFDFNNPLTQATQDAALQGLNVPNVNDFFGNLRNQTVSDINESSAARGAFGGSANQESIARGLGSLNLQALGMQNQFQNQALNNALGAQGQAFGQAGQGFGLNQGAQAQRFGQAQDVFNTNQGAGQQDFQNQMALAQQQQGLQGQQFGQDLATQQFNNQLAQQQFQNQLVPLQFGQGFLGGPTGAQSLAAGQGGPQAPNPFVNAFGQFGQALTGAI